MLELTSSLPWSETLSVDFFLALPSSGNTIIFQPPSQRLTSDRTASYKLLTLCGTMFASIGYLLLILRWRGNTSIWESLYIGPGGFGTGVAMATTFVALAAGVDEDQMAIGSTGLYLSANIGGLVGMSLASNILQASLRTGLKSGLRDLPNRQTVCLRGILDCLHINCPG